MAEVRDEAAYVPHNRHKIALIFSAMRHFCKLLKSRGHVVHYYGYDQAVPSLRKAVEADPANAEAAADRTKTAQVSIAPYRAAKVSAPMAPPARAASRWVPVHYSGEPCQIRTRRTITRCVSRIVAALHMDDAGERGL